ncbi:hydroxymethylbilane synthase [Siphonobacter aquaeclarae]|uniref:Porphobilinogen deaminase n=1 Tax=Siphonobacter aquaeclarae TaxID=563176 RepID=A0A1G9UKD8_9BACT|nr:hydroxymethylbilane synthase [Siphonobacter aquaeclarae]SDM60337.1 hydroxymethylbilane synthase [Siphonobacter aquaeclarae]
MKIRIGSRGSRLALWQAEYVAEQLRHGGLDPEIVIIETRGDKILDRSLSKIGSKGVFTEELEEQLRSGEIDIAQHSAKDLQSSLAEDLEIIAFTPREAVNDVLFSLNPELSLESGEPFVIGTSSTRRVATLKRYYPHIQVVDMRGNLQTRLQKLQNGACDALLLAYAGVHRMGYEEFIAEHLSTDIFTPAVGQGSVAIECAASLDPVKKARVRELLNDPVTEQCIRAERTFLAVLQGGCSVPVFGLATPHGDRIALTAGIISLDGKQELRRTEINDAGKASDMAQQLAERLLRQGAAEILREIRSAL